MLTLNESRAKMLVAYNRMGWTRFNPTISQGFTLIELLIVMIILGILTAVSLPNFINQIGKARETDAKINLGAIGRAQQAYHFEHQTFATSLLFLNEQGQFQSKYYSFPEPIPATASIVKHKADPVSDQQDQTKHYSLGVYDNAGQMSMIMCQGSAVGQDVDAPDTNGGICSNNGKKLE
jgi:type IV pilus assembly protein PilA